MAARQQDLKTPPDGFVVRQGRWHGFAVHAWVHEAWADWSLEDLWELLFATPEPLLGVLGRGGIGTLRLPNEVGARVASAHGLAASEVHAVVRGARRGGLMGRVLGDRYLDRTRSHRELAALVALQRGSVAAVTPLAAIAKTRAGVTRHTLMTVFEAEAQSLPVFVAEAPHLRRNAVCAAGAACEAAFQLGLDHPDLHPDNLLVRVEPKDDEASPRILLLDLDNVSVWFEPVPRAMRDRMLLRFARYTMRRVLPAPVQRTDLLRFLRCAGEDRATRRATVLRLKPRLAEQMARRRFRRTRRDGRSR